MVVMRSAFARTAAAKNCVGKATTPLLAGKVGVPTIQVATMRATYGEKYPYEKPWPYEQKKFNLFHEIVMMEKSLFRMNENSKIIIVEGNINVGKSQFAQDLAKNFDLKYIPSTTDADCFTYDGFDIRSVDDILSSGARSYDHADFLSDPHPEKGIMGRLQLMWLVEKFMTYARGLEHMLNTGQGVVMVQSVFSDEVFLDALVRIGWQNRTFRNYYNDIKDNAIVELLKPHLTIYLDAPVSTIRERVKKSTNPLEANSPNLSDKYLQTLEDVFKERFLPKMRLSGEVVEIDWTEPSDAMDMEVISEEIQNLVLENDDKEDPKFSDWQNMNDDMVALNRRRFGDETFLDNNFTRPLPFECPELMYSISEADERRRIIWEHPALHYAVGHAPQFGQRKLWSF